MNDVTVEEKIETVARNMHSILNGYYTLEGCFEFVRAMFLDDVNRTYYKLLVKGDI